MCLIKETPIHRSLEARVNAFYHLYITEVDIQQAFQQDPLSVAGRTVSQ